MNIPIDNISSISHRAVLRLVVWKVTKNTHEFVNLFFNIAKVSHKTQSCTTILTLVFKLFVLQTSEHTHTVCTEMNMYTTHSHAHGIYNMVRIHVCDSSIYYTYNSMISCMLKGAVFLFVI